MFDKGYVNYGVYKIWMGSGAFYVIRLNENATYEVVYQIWADIHDFLAGGTILDQHSYSQNDLIQNGELRGGFVLVR